MEEDKKRKKNKKKKSKQATKPTESITLDARDSVSWRLDVTQMKTVLETGRDTNVLETGRDTNENGQFSGGDFYNVGRNTDTDKHEHLVNGSEGKNLAKAEEQHWLEREATFQEKLKELQAEKNGKIQNEAILEEKIKQLMNEKHEYIQKEADQEEQIKQLRDERNSFMQKETSLMKKIVQLERENDALIQKEETLEKTITELQRDNDTRLQKVAALEMNILQLEGEKDSWLQKEADFEEKINHLVDEAAGLNMKAVSLEEKLKQLEREKDTWILSESSSKELIATQNNENTKLQARVIELEQSNKTLLEEKKLFEENISSLQLQIKNLQSPADFPHSSMANKVNSDDGDLNQIGATDALGDISMTENLEVVGKVNGLYVEPVYLLSEASNIIPVSDSIRSLEEIMIEDQMNDKYPSELLPNSSSKIIEIDHEIVQITNNMKVAPQNDEKTEEVSLTDAPLIGAPFRLISFFARYVSGADLVKQ